MDYKKDKRTKDLTLRDIHVGVDYNFGREKTHYINLQSWLMGARYEMLDK